MKFVLPLSLAQLNHMNTRIEKHGDEEKLACDLNFEFECTSEFALKQLCLGDWEALNYAMFDKTPERRVREASLAPFKFNHKMTDHMLRFGVHLDNGTDEALVSNSATLKNFHVTPQHGEVVKVFMQAQITPDKKDLAVYAQGLEQGTVQIQIDPPAQQDLQLAVDNTSREEAA